MVRTTRVGRSPRGRNPSIRVQIPASPLLPIGIVKNQAEFSVAARPRFPPPHTVFRWSPSGIFEVTEFVSRVTFDRLTVFVFTNI